MNAKKKSILIALAIVLVLFFLWRYMQSHKSAEKTETAKEPGATSNSPSTAVVKKPAKTVALTNSTVLEWKDPAMKGDRVEWIQNSYNAYAKFRKQKGKTGDWPQIEPDGVFGKATHEAVNRVMGKHKVSWTDFKKRIDYYKSQFDKKTPGDEFNWQLAVISGGVIF